MDNVNRPNDFGLNNQDDSVPLWFLLGDNYGGYVSEAVKDHKTRRTIQSRNNESQSRSAPQLHLRQEPVNGSVSSLLRTVGRSERERLAARILLGDNPTEVAQHIEGKAKTYYRPNQKQAPDPDSLHYHTGGNLRHVHDREWLAPAAVPVNFSEQSKKEAHASRKDHLAAAAKDLLARQPTQSMQRERQYIEGRRQFERELNNHKILSLRRAINGSNDHFKKLRAYKARLELETELQKMKEERQRHLNESQEKVRERRMTADIRQDIKAKLSSQRMDPSAVAQLMRTLNVQYLEPNEAVSLREEEEERDFESPMLSIPSKLCKHPSIATLDIDSVAGQSDNLSQVKAQNSSVLNLTVDSTMDSKTCPSPDTKQPAIFGAGFKTGTINQHPRKTDGSSDNFSISGSACKFNHSSISSMISR